MIEKTIKRPRNYDWDGYTIALYLDEQGDWLARLLEMPNVSAFGDSIESAIDELYEAWEGIKDCYREDGAEIPVAPRRQIPVNPSESPAIL